MSAQRNNTDDSALECPTCRFSFQKLDHSSKQAGKGSSFKMTHNARAVFTDDICPCPMCHKEQNAQPMVNLPCGHVLCQDDFRTLGGEVTQLSEPSRGNPSRTSDTYRRNSRTLASPNGTSHGMGTGALDDRSFHYTPRTFEGLSSLVPPAIHASPPDPTFSVAPVTTNDTDGPSAASAIPENQPSDGNEEVN